MLDEPVYAVVEDMDFSDTVRKLQCLAKEMRFPLLQDRIHRYCRMCWRWVK